jgi:hypothetical protein
MTTKLRLICLPSVLALLVCGALADTEQSVKVVDADDDLPVSCYVTRVAPDGKAENLGLTSPPGQLKLSGPCGQDYILQFRPESASLYFERALLCEQVMTVHIVKLRKILSANGAKLNRLLETLRVSSRAQAALASNELAKKAPSTMERASYKITTALEMGIFLSVEKPVVYDREHHEVVPSGELEDSARTFQRLNGLDANGKINSETLKAASGKSISELLKAP